ncbi:hypothetical protein [Hymenobacter roseosalivarius]|uniref:hypothetical protein n=1 Tax=Hymenobacter roseosalivarius TaxID=89967 RepID=UPI00117BBD54|nr:hypothetical protein [Hymenobacter roseosalivarius]
MQTFLFPKADLFPPASFLFFSIFECPVCASGRVVLFFCLSHFFFEVRLISLVLASWLLAVLSHARYVFWRREAA